MMAWAEMVEHEAWAEMVEHEAWAEMVEHEAWAEIKEENGNPGHRKSGDVAVDVMAIVGSVLWDGPASGVPWLTSGERLM